MAAEELKTKCENLLARFRQKLANDPETLAVLNEWVSKREAAVELQVQLIGGSWGGPGEGAFAMLSYHDDLEAMKESLHFQN